MFKKHHLKIKYEACRHIIITGNTLLIENTKTDLRSSERQDEKPEEYLSGSVALLALPGLVCMTGTTGSAAGAGVTGGCAVVR